MYYLLTRGNVSYEFHKRSWLSTLTLARLHGWKPLPPPLPTVPDAHGAASWSDLESIAAGRRMSDADSRALADALARSLPDLPEFDASDDEDDDEDPDNLRFVFQWWSGPQRDYLQDHLIPFFRGGGFHMAPLAETPPATLVRADGAAAEAEREGAHDGPVGGEGVAGGGGDGDGEANAGAGPAHGVRLPAAAVADGPPYGESALYAMDGAWERQLRLCRDTAAGCTEVALRVRLWVGLLAVARQHGWQPTVFRTAAHDPGGGAAPQNPAVQTAAWLGWRLSAEDGWELANVLTRPVVVGIAAGAGERAARLPGSTSVPVIRLWSGDSLRYEEERLLKFFRGGDFSVLPPLDYEEEDEDDWDDEDVSHNQEVAL